MAEKTRRSRRTYLTWLIAAGLAAGVCCLVPPFRIVSLEAARKQQQSDVFDAAAYAGEFWHDKLPYVTDQATDAVKLIEAIRRDPAAAKHAYARMPPFGRVYYYFVRGSGVILSAGENSLGLTLTRGGTIPDVTIATAHVTGNVIQEGTGLMEPSDFTSLMDYNDVATEIKRIIESRVLTPFREKTVSVGSRIRFVGCAELNDDRRSPLPLPVVPIVLEAQ